MEEEEPGTVIVRPPEELRFDARGVWEADNKDVEDDACGFSSLRLAVVGSLSSVEPDMSLPPLTKIAPQLSQKREVIEES